MLPDIPLDTSQEALTDIYSGYLERSTSFRRAWSNGIIRRRLTCLDHRILHSNFFGENCECRVNVFLAHCIDWSDTR